jgi:hypothetical protein
VNLRLMTALVAAGGDPTAMSDDGETPLHLSSGWPPTDMALQLKPHGPSMLATNGDTPRLTARGDSHTDGVVRIWDVANGTLM